MVITALAPMPVVGFFTQPNQASIASEKFLAVFSFHIISLNEIRGQWLCILASPLPIIVVLWMV